MFAMPAPSLAPLRRRLAIAGLVIVLGLLIGAASARADEPAATAAAATTTAAGPGTSGLTDPGDDGGMSHPDPYGKG